ncbi:ABC transporter substrate-binding protein [Leeia sp. TBRC 13508]|uniref:ABC transporter substrate-binding protein n=1 Tax=Leeia speluncae TaxID=2884804 RepID=A0ABS8DAF7_9NEIS|nr:ABC transporter substrate-binding protein [Leeia speluncae]MCB6184593.1 ABC transporter substrate-binding protein [Leeia speluncae]
MRLRITAISLALFSLSSAAFAKPLTICTESSPEGFDVVQYNSLTTTNASADLIFNRLVDFDATKSKVVPSLAERWEVSADGLNYTFHLRKNVRFQTTDYFKPTRLLQADDVIFSFERMINPNHPWAKIVGPNGFPHAQSFQLPALIKSIKKVDNNTVRFELSKPEATFLGKLTMGFASIYSAEYADQLLKSGNAIQLNSKPIGTGPFVLKSFQKDAVVRYVANPSYFGKKTNVDRLILAITPDSAVRVQKVKANECQIALSPKPQEWLGLQADKAVKIVTTSSFGTAFLAINTQHKPLDNTKVRQAINLAFDQNTYLKTVFNGTATSANNPYPPSTWSYAKDLPDYPYDPAKAKKLLAEAGFPNGFDTTLWVRSSSAFTNPNPKAGAELLQADLAKIGIKAEIKTLEWGELIKRGKAGEHDLLFMGWVGDNGDPDDFLTPQFSCAAVQSGTNFARYCDPQLEKLIQDGQKTADIPTRTKLYVAAQKIIRDQGLWIPLAHPLNAAVTTPNVSGFKVSPFGRLDISSVVLK